MDAYVCNKCGRVVTLEKMKKEMFTLELRTDEIGKFNKMHLCNECKNKFYDWLEQEASK